MSKKNFSVNFNQMCKVIENVDVGPLEDRKPYLRYFLILAKFLKEKAAAVVDDDVLILLKIAIECNAVQNLVCETYDFVNKDEENLDLTAAFNQLQTALNLFPPEYPNVVMDDLRQESEEEIQTRKENALDQLLECQMEFPKILVDCVRGLREAILQINSCITDRNYEVPVPEELEHSVDYNSHAVLTIMLNFVAEITMSTKKNIRCLEANQERNDKEESDLMRLRSLSDKLDILRPVLQKSYETNAKTVF